ncbi:unnamed protein product [Symbiodinium sp. KB8]|nr:unnamed protein product [Symbiodinium sp. KB8]
MAQLFRVLDSSSNTSTPEVYGTLVTLPNIHAGTPFYTGLLRAGPNETSAGSMQVFAGESVVDIPTALFTSEARPGYAVISITDSQPGDEISAILAAYTQASGDVLVTQPISIKASLSEHGVNGTLPAPLNFTMPITDANATGDLTCVYWDEQQDAWSSQGVMTVSAAGGSVRCSTTHLSLFAAIIRAVVTTLVCSNAAAIFSLEGLQSLLKWQWAVQAPAIIQWVTLLAGLCLVFAAKRMDQRYMEHVDALEGFQEIRILRPVEFSRREFVTDLREYFLGVFHPSRRVASQLVKRKIGLGVGELYRLQRVSGVTAWHKQARSILSKFSEQRLLLKLTMLYQVHCRWFSFATPSLKASCAQRCSVLLAKLYSGWAIMAVFYGSTALAPDQPECAPPEALLDKLVRSAVIAWISAIFGSVPFVVLLALVHFGGNSASSARTNLFWGYMTIHLILCALVVSIFLASVSPADGEKFLLSTVTNLLTSLLVTPVLLTVLFGACMLARADDLDRLLEWQQEDQFEVSVSKVVVPVEQLQATMKLDLRLNVTVLAEVFGDHSSSTTLDRNKVSGSFSSSDTFLVTKRQVLMFTVIVVELQRRHAFTLHAVALGSDALAGYSGALPLFVPGKKSPCAEVLVEVAPAGGKQEKVDAKGQDEEVLIVQVAPNNEGTPLEEKVDNKSPDEEGVTVPVVALEPEPPCEAPTPVRVQSPKGTEHDYSAGSGCLSGAGPAVIAFTSGRCGDVIAQNASEREEFNVAEALLSAADAIGCPGHVLITKPVEHGGYIVSETKVSDPDSRESRIHYVQD